MLSAFVVAAAVLLAADVPADANVHAVDASGDVVVNVENVVGKAARSVVVTGDVKASLDGDKLVLRAPAHAAAGTRGAVTLVVEHLSSVTASGTAKVSANVNGKPIVVEADKASVVVLTGKTSALTIVAAGTSKVDAAGLVAQAVFVRMNEAARAEVTATASLTCDLQRASRLVVAGKPKSVTKNVAGVAKLTFQ